MPVCTDIFDKSNGRHSCFVYGHAPDDDFLCLNHLFILNIHWFYASFHCLSSFGYIKIAGVFISTMFVGCFRTSFEIIRVMCSIHIVIT